MNDKTIKEIRINTIHVFFWCEDYNNMYTDTLRISKNWISYKRKSIKDEKNSSARRFDQNVLLQICPKGTGRKNEGGVAGGKLPVQPLYLKMSL